MTSFCSLCSELLLQLVGGSGHQTWEHRIRQCNACIAWGCAKKGEKVQPPGPIIISAFEHPHLPHLTIPPLALLAVLCGPKIRAQTLNQFPNEGHALHAPLSLMSPRLAQVCCPCIGKARIQSPQEVQS